jgi:hypothetical protein
MEKSYWCHNSHEWNNQKQGHPRDVNESHERYRNYWRASAATLALNGQMDKAQTAIRRLLAIDPTCTLTAMVVRYG